jgi:hypothetical protein
VALLWSDADGIVHHALQPLRCDTAYKLKKEAHCA